jgi:hypothetical protein
LREHSLKEYKIYLIKLKTTLQEENPVDDILTKNWETFKTARDSMKPPSQEYDDWPDNFLFSGGTSLSVDKPNKEQIDAGVIANNHIAALFQSVQQVNEPTFTADSTEIAKQYIQSIYTFDSTQDNFFQGFLTNEEPTGLDDYFKESLI